MDKITVIQRTVKTSVFGFVIHFLGYGSILLLPALMREDNQRNGLGLEECDNAVNGTQFLILAAVHGGANLLGRVVGAVLHNRVRFKVSQPIFAACMTVCYGVLLTSPSIPVTSLSLGISKFLYAAMVLEKTLMSYDPVYIGTAYLVESSAVAVASAQFGGAIGVALAVFLTPYNAVVIAFFLSCMQIAVTCCIRDRD